MALLLVVFASGCVSNNKGAGAVEPTFHCPEIDVDPGTYIYGAVWHAGAPVAGAAAFAHGPQDESVDANANDLGCFLLSLPEPGRWEGEARYDEKVGSFAVDIEANDMQRVLVVLA